MIQFLKNEHRVVQHVMVRCGDVSKCFVVNFRTHRLIAGIKTIKIFQNFLTCFIRNFDHQNYRLVTGLSGNVLKKEVCENHVLTYYKVGLRIVLE